MIETAEQLLSREKLPRRVGKIIETQQECSTATASKALHDFVLRPQQELRRRRQVPLHAMLLVVAGGKQPKRKRKRSGKNRQSKSSTRASRRKRKETADNTSATMITKGERSPSKKAKRRGSNATAATVDADDSSDSISMISCKSTDSKHTAAAATVEQKKTPPVLFVSAVYNPHHCTAENVKIFLDAIASSLVELKESLQDEVWLEATELGLQGMMAPVMEEWMADVSYLVTLAHVQQKVDTLTAQMQANLEKAWKNTADAEELYDMSLGLLDKTKVFKKKSSNLRQQKTNRNMTYIAAMGASATTITGIGLLIAFL